MHHWTVHAKVEFPRFPPDVRPGEGSFHNFWSCQKWINIYRFTLISFIGFPAILSALQPFQMCIFKRKYSKWTFSNGPQTDDGEKGLWQICMHHWTVHAKVEFQKCPWDVRPCRAHSTTLDPELRNDRFTLISFIGFPAILGALQPFQICIFKRENIVNEHFQMALSWWEKGLWQICMHHWTVHAKVEFQKCPWDVSLAGVHSTTLDPELRNEFKSFSNLGSVPQLLILNWWGQRFMANLHASLDSTCKSRISKMSMRCQTLQSSIPQLWILNSEMRFTLISFMGVSTMLGTTMGHYQICIFNWKYSKVTFSNGPQMMRKRFMANLHASLDSTCKSRISKMSMRCQILNLQRSIPQHKVLILNSEMRFIESFFSNAMGALQSNLYFPQLLMALNWWGQRFMANLHASLDSTCKSRISKMSMRCQNLNLFPIESVPQLLILNSKHASLQK